MPVYRDPAIESGVGAQVAAEFDAGVGSRNVKEARAVKGANPDIFNGCGLDRKIGRLNPAYAKQGCRGGEKNLSSCDHKSSDHVHSVNGRMQDI